MSGTPPALHTQGAADLVLAKHISMSNLVEEGIGDLASSSSHTHLQGGSLCAGQGRGEETLQSSHNVVMRMVQVSQALKHVFEVTS